MTMKSRIAFAVLAAGLLAIPAMAQGPYKYHAVTPCRVLDTRACSVTNTAPICGTGNYFGVRSYRVQGKCGIPDGAKALTLNATILSPTASGWLTLWPAGAATPLVSTLNYLPADAAIANGAIVPLATVPASPDPTADLSTWIAIGAANHADLLIDVTGYFDTN